MIDGLVLVTALFGVALMGRRGLSIPGGNDARLRAVGRWRSG